MFSQKLRPWQSKDLGQGPAGLPVATLPASPAWGPSEALSSRSGPQASILLSSSQRPLSHRQPEVRLALSPDTDTRTQSHTLTTLAAHPDRHMCAHTLPPLPGDGTPRPL